MSVHIFTNQGAFPTEAVWVDATTGRAFGPVFTSDMIVGPDAYGEDQEPLTDPVEVAEDCFDWISESYRDPRSLTHEEITREVVEWQRVSNEAWSLTLYLYGDTAGDSWRDYRAAVRDGRGNDYTQHALKGKVNR